MVKNLKRFMKKRNVKKGTTQRRCYKCGEKDHFIADCPKKIMKMKIRSTGTRARTRTTTRRRGTRRRARNTRRRMARLMLVKDGSQVMTPTMRARHHLPCSPLHQHQGSSTTSPMMKMITPCASWIRGIRYQTTQTLHPLLAPNLVK